MAVASCGGSLAFPSIGHAFRAWATTARDVVEQFSLHLDFLDDSTRASFGDTCRFDPFALSAGPFPVLPRSRTPLMGFIKDSHPPTSPRESTPGRAVARPSVPCVPSSALVPSLSFHPTPTVYSSRGFAGLLHPAADHWVRRVSIHACTTQGRTRRSRDLPSGACPSKLFPRKQQ